MLYLVAGYNIVLLACLKLCRDIQKLCRDKDYCIFHFFFFLLLFYLFSLLLQLTATKHKVGQYSIIWNKNRSRNVKNMSEKWIKNS